MKSLTNTAIALALTGVIGAGQACSNAQWNVKTAEAKSVVDGAIRYEGLCALEAVSGKKVEQSIAGSGDTYFRFYVYVTDAQTADVQIFSAKAGTNEVKASLASGGKLKLGTKSVALPAKKWAEVEIQVKGNVANAWVNKAQVITNESVTGGNVDKIAIGALSGTLTGKVYFDSFVASNGQRVGESGVSIGSDKELIPGDANGDGKIRAFDVVVVRDEISGNSNAKGVPDCNNDGKIRAFDVTCIRSKL